jgi:hypothetical protein
VGGSLVWLATAAACAVPAGEALVDDSGSAAEAAPEGLADSLVQVMRKDPSSEPIGTCTILAREGDTYTCVTNAHVYVFAGDRPEVRTGAGDSLGRASCRVPWPGFDLAVCTFRSASSHQVLAVCEARSNEAMLALGFPVEMPSLHRIDGTVQSTDVCAEEGESLFWTAPGRSLQKGMSGGPTLRAGDNCVVGINADHRPLFGGCRGQDGRPLQEELCNMNKSVAIGDVLALLPGGSVISGPEMPLPVCSRGGAHSPQDGEPGGQPEGAPGGGAPGGRGRVW